jgi:hypothetical protein
VNRKTTIEEKIITIHVTKVLDPHTKVILEYLKNSYKEIRERSPPKMAKVMKK